MSLRFRRSVSIIPGVSLNLGLHGAGLSVGPADCTLESTDAVCTPARACQAPDYTGFITFEQVKDSTKSTARPGGCECAMLAAIVSACCSRCVPC
jgi:hypothetical protein